MSQARSPDCDCPDAISGSASDSGSGDSDYSNSYSLNGGLGVPRDLDLGWSFDAFTRKDSFFITFLNSGGGTMASHNVFPCAAGSDAGGLTVPAGCATIQVDVDASCDPSETSPPNAWTFAIDWLEVRCM